MRALVPVRTLVISIKCLVVLVTSHSLATDVFIGERIEHYRARRVSYKEHCFLQLIE